MEHSPIAVESVKNLQAAGKDFLEGILGRKLEENQQVFIMVLSPGKEPDEAGRRQARAGLEETFRKTEVYAREHDITDAEVDDAIEEARKQVRLKKD
jgi:hypothetical protein